MGRALCIPVTPVVNGLRSAKLIRYDICQDRSQFCQRQ